MYVKILVPKLCKKNHWRYIRYMTPQMSPLPLIRLDNPEAWNNVGVDYLGPIFSKAECGGGAQTLLMQKFGSRSCLLYTSPSPRDRQKSRMPSSA